MVGNETNKNCGSFKRERKLLTQKNIIFLWRNGFVLPNIRPVRYREFTSKGRCQSGPKKSVCYTEVSTITYPLHRGFSMKV